MDNALLTKSGSGSKLAPNKANRYHEAARVADELERMCRELAPGDKIPTHTVLMARFGASERTVLRALDDLFRAGRIVRIRKAGTFVADPHPVAAVSPPEVEVATRSIMAIAKLDHAFFSRSIEVLYRLAKASDLSVVFQPVENVAELVLPPPSDPRSHAGYIVIGSALTPLAEEVHKAGHRCVAIGEIAPGSAYDVASVHPDNSQGGFLCAEHLIKLGHRRLGFAMDFATSRWEGHQRAVTEATMEGIEVSTTHMESALFEHWHNHPGSVVHYFNRPDAPTGVCVWNDTTAMQLITTLRRDGVMVPEDVSIVGYDNLPQAANFTLSLSTIDTNITQLLRTALRILTQDTPPGPAYTVVHAPTLVERESSGCVPGCRIPV